MSNLVEHAKKELTMIGEEKRVVDGYLKVIQAVADMHHSGGSMSYFLPTLVKLLNGENLKPLTNDPEEWDDRSKMSGVPMWQNKRNSKAFTYDEYFLTYWIVDDLTRIVYRTKLTIGPGGV